MEFALFACGFICGCAFIVMMSALRLSGKISREEEREQARRKKFEEYDIDL